MQLSFFGIVFVLVAAIAVAAVFICFVLLRRSQVGAPACGKCSYAVEGLEGLRCPECGSDLRDVGIITSDMTRRLSPRSRTTLAVLLFMIVYPIVAAPAVTVAQRLLAPQRWLSSTDVDMTSVTPGVPRLVMRWSDTPGVPGGEHVELRFQRTDESMSGAIEIDLPEKSYRIAPASGVARPTGTVDEAIIDAWLGAEGHAGSPDARDPSSRPALGAAIDAMLDRRITDRSSGMMTIDGYNSVGVSTTSTPIRRSPWLPWTAGVLCVLGCLLGVFLIVRRGLGGRGTTPARVQT